jgi:hypothetical protein
MQSVCLKTLLEVVIPPPYFNAVVGSTKPEGGNTNLRIKVSLAAG